MNETIIFNTCCDNCGCFTEFQSKGEIISTSNGRTISLLTPEEEKKVRICEKCGCILKCSG